MNNDMIRRGLDKIEEMCKDENTYTTMAVIERVLTAMLEPEVRTCPACYSSSDGGCRCGFFDEPEEKKECHCGLPKDICICCDDDDIWWNCIKCKEDSPIRKVYDKWKPKINNSLEPIDFTGEKWNDMWNAIKQYCEPEDTIDSRARQGLKDVIAFMYKKNREEK